MNMLTDLTINEKLDCVIKVNAVLYLFVNTLTMPLLGILLFLI